MSATRQLRRALHSHLQPNVAVHYKAMQMQHASTLVLDILRDPEYHIEHARRCVFDIWDLF